MKKYWKLFGIVTVLVAAIAFAGVTAAFAQGPNQPVAPGPGAVNQGQAGGGMGYMAVEEADMHAAIADALGITVAQLESEIAQGKSLTILAAELGVDFAGVQAAMEAVHAAALQQAVDNGALSQDQADWMQSRGGGGQGQRGAVNSGANNGTVAGGRQASRGAADGTCIYETP